MTTTKLKEKRQSVASAVVKVSDALLHEVVPSAWSPSVLLLVVVGASSGVRDSVPRQVSTQQATVYATVAGVSATVLGFLIAGATLLAVLPQERPSVRRLVTQGFVQRAVVQLGRASVAMAVLTGVALLGLLIDVPPSNRSVQLGCGSNWIWIVLAAAVPATLLLGRSILTLNRSLGVAADKAQPPT